MASLHGISNKEQALEDMQRAAHEAVEALREVRMLLDEVALDMRFARHASRNPLRLSSDRIENVARTLVGEAQSGGPVGTNHASVVGKVALAAATMAFLPFAEDAGPVAMHRFRASHERAMRNLESVHVHAERAQSETREDLSLQISALFKELDSLAAEVGMEIAHPRGELEEAVSTGELPASWALEGLRQVSERVRMDAERASADEDPGWALGPASSRLERLAEIEFLIAEIFAQLTGDTVF